MIASQRITPIDLAASDRIRRQRIEFLQRRIDRCMRQLRGRHASMATLGKMYRLIVERNNLYTESELRQMARERGLL